MNLTVGRPSINPFRKEKNMHIIMLDDVLKNPIFLNQIKYHGKELSYTWFLIREINRNPHLLRTFLV